MGGRSAKGARNTAVCSDHLAVSRIYLENLLREIATPVFALREREIARKSLTCNNSSSILSEMVCTDWLLFSNFASNVVNAYKNGKCFPSSLWEPVEIETNCNPNELKNLCQKAQVSYFIVLQVFAKGHTAENKHAIRKTYSVLEISDFGRGLRRT